MAAVIITRNRPDLLRQTILSLQRSTYPACRITVSDDSSDDATSRMLATDFPEVIWTQGPKRGRAANRNNGIVSAKADYTLVSDDDILIDSRFIGAAMKQTALSPSGMFFTATSEHGHTILPNALNFLGYSTKQYPPGVPYTTANSHCFILSKSIVDCIAYDEVIEIYGYEEMDFAYRVAASGFLISCIPYCANIHLAPRQASPIRLHQDASRLYVAFKRHAYVDRRPLVAIAFVCVAIPHHIFVSICSSGWNGLLLALSNIRLAARMLRNFRHNN